VEEPPPRARPIHGGRLVELRRDRLEPRQIGDDDEREELPDARHDQRPHDVVLAEPGGWDPGRARRDERVVDQPVGVVQEPLPQDDRHDRRDRVGEEDDAPEQAAPAERLVQQQGGGHPQPELEHDRASRVDRPVPDAPPKLLVGREVAVVAEADEGLRGEEGVLGEEAQPEVIEDRVRDEAAQEEQ